MTTSDPIFEAVKAVLRERFPFHPFPLDEDARQVVSAVRSFMQTEALLIEDGVRQSVVNDLLLAARGREEYATNTPQPEVLLSEAITFRWAARVATGGDVRKFALQGALPSWTWGHVDREPPLPQPEPAQGHQLAESGSEG